MDNQVRKLMEEVNKHGKIGLAAMTAGKLRLKWSQIETAELRGEPYDEKTGVLQKKQIKKKRKRRR